MQSWFLHFRAVVLVTLAYFGVYYAILIYGLFTKRRVARQCEAAGEKFYRYSKQYPELLAADRMQLNMLEHMPPFLVLLWLQAVVVSVHSATILGGAYVLVRATYPLFLGRRIYRNFRLRVLLNTFTGYSILAAMVGWQAYALLISD